MSVLTIGIVRDCFYLLISYSERGNKYSQWKQSLYLKDLLILCIIVCNFLFSTLKRKNLKLVLVSTSLYFTQFDYTQPVK